MTFAELLRISATIFVLPKKIGDIRESIVLQIILKVGLMDN